MKVSSINYIKRHPNSHSMFRGEGKVEEQLYRSALPNSKQEVYTSAIELQNKTVNKTALKSGGFFNAKNSPSFGCAPAQAPKQMGKLANWVTDSPLAHKFLELAGKNPAVFEAAAALIVTGALRPATIMALPASRADKEKNKKAAAHSISSGLIGLTTSVLLFQPIVAALNKLDKNPKKYGLDTKGDMYKELTINRRNVTNTMKRKTIYLAFFKNAPKMLFAPVTAAATIALIPIIDKCILSKIFKPAVAKAELTPMDVYRSTSFKSTTSKANKTYKSFIGGQA